MTTICQLCGEIIRADSAAMILNPGTDAEAARAVAEISLFDRLAGRMSQHLEKHQAENYEMVAVMHLAAKVYAMTWAESPHSEPEFSALRDAWRTGILQMMQTTTKPAAVYDAVAAAATPPALSSTVESNEQKSERNASS